MALGWMGMQASRRFRAVLLRCVTSSCGTGRSAAGHGSAHARGGEAGVALLALAEAVNGADHDAALPNSQSCVTPGLEVGSPPAPRGCALPASAGCWSRSSASGAAASAWQGSHVAG